MLCVIGTPAWHHYPSGVMYSDSGEGSRVSLSPVRGPHTHSYTQQKPASCFKCQCNQAAGVGTASACYPRHCRSKIRPTCGLEVMAAGMHLSGAAGKPSADAAAVWGCSSGQVPPAAELAHPAHAIWQLIIWIIPRKRLSVAIGPHQAFSMCIRQCRNTQPSFHVSDQDTPVWSQKSRSQIACNVFLTRGLPD